jgi:acyl carrier protein
VRWSDNGELEYISRKDNQIKINGHRIELGEIESALEQIDVINNAVIVGVDNGEGKQLSAFVVLKEGEDLDVKTLKESLLIRLPHYMVPTLWQSIDAMPLTPNGKVDRKALQAMQVVAQQHVEPLEGDIEHQLALIWADILKIDSQLIGRNANFFALGGHSLVLLNLMNAIREQFELEVSMGDVFNRETLADLAELLAERKAQAIQRASYSAVTTARASDDEPEELLI